MTAPTLQDLIDSALLLALVLFVIFTLDHAAC